MHSRIQRKYGAVTLRKIYHTSVRIKYATEVVHGACSE